jgi:phosphoribosylglycinamide formyltransferase 2
VEEALREPGTLLRLFGKPEAHRSRRMGVVVASGRTTDEARDKAKRAAAKVKVVGDAVAAPTRPVAALR